MLVDSKILLAKLEEKENKFLIGNFLSKELNTQFNQSTGEIIFLSNLEEFFDENEIEAGLLRVILSQQFFKTFSFPFEKTFTPKDVKEQIGWELSVLFPSSEQERFTSSYFISDYAGKQYVNAIAAEKKFLELVFKFAVRRNLRIEFFEHPAISAFNGVKFSDTEFDYLIYAEDDFITLLEKGAGKISRISAFQSDEKEKLKNSVKKNNPKIILAGGDAEKIKGELEKLQVGQFMEFDIRKFAAEDALNNGIEKYLPAFVGLFSRVK